MKKEYIIILATLGNIMTQCADQPENQARKKLTILQQFEQYLNNTRTALSSPGYINKNKTIVIGGKTIHPLNPVGEVLARDWVQSSLNNYSKKADINEKKILIEMYRKFLSEYGLDN